LLLKKCFNFEALIEAYANAQKANKKYKVAAIHFRQYDMLFLQQLHSEIHSGNYEPSAYTQFTVYEPKERVINAPAFRDKIVQFAAHKALCDIYSPVYIKHSYACLEGRGTHRCAKQIQRNLQICKRNYNEPWIIKADIKKYFYSIDREILKTLLRKKITDGKFLCLVDKIIDSSPEGEKGISLGCVTSQDLATIYLNEIDQFIVRYLGYKYYTRFMDDIVIVTPGRTEAQAVLAAMEEYLHKRLQLRLNSKTDTFPLAQGVNACGYKIHPTHALLRSNSKKGMKRRMKSMDRKHTLGHLDVKYIQQAVNSWVGHAMHGDSLSLCHKIFDKYDYISIRS